LAPGIALPPAERYIAVVSNGSEEPVEVRILGDSDRGYLLAGHFKLPGGEDCEYWFEDVQEARAAASRYVGIPMSLWEQVE
jgi:hypothetical protein